MRSSQSGRGKALALDAEDPPEQRGPGVVGLGEEAGLCGRRWWRANGTIPAAISALGREADWGK